ncbi:MAG: hypothetical protein ACRDNB_07530 [Gaiellaceae bacterium]
MELQTAALLAAALWLSGLTLVVLLLVRQLGLVTLRLDAGPGSASVVPRDGPDVGTELPPSVLDRIPALHGGVSYLLLVSPTCTSCHEVASRLDTVSVTGRVVALVPGGEELAGPFAELLPSHCEIVRDPVASEIANELDLDRTPFVLEIDDGFVSGRAHLFRASDFQQLIDARASSNAAEIVKLAKEGNRHAVA